MQIDLAALISTRICHDLINPLGAINNGLELLAATGTRSGPELDLISESSERATAKLNFLRVAFGNTENQADMKTATLREIIAYMYAQGRFRVVWPVDVDSLQRTDAKLLLLLVLAAENSAPLGGQCLLRSGDGLILSLTAPRIVPHEASWNHAAGHSTDNEITAANVQFAAIREILDRTGRTMTWHHTSDVLEARID